MPRAEKVTTMLTYALKHVTMSGVSIFSIEIEERFLNRDHLLLKRNNVTKTSAWLTWFLRRAKG